MTEDEILDAMTARLQDKGWIKGVIWEEEFVPNGTCLTFDGYALMRSVKGKACLRGTAELCSAFTLTMFELSAVADRLVTVIAELFPERITGKAHWAAVECFNDHKDTTFEDIMLVVKTARENAHA